MTNRSPVAVFFLTLITFGIYGIVWQVKTKNEMNKLGANIPTAWLIIIPLVNLYWLWKYCEGVEIASGGKMSGVLAFILLFLLGIIGMAIVQSEFNKIGSSPVLTGADAAVLPPAATPFQPTPSVAPAATPRPAVFPSDTPIPPTNPLPPTQTPPVV